jgi:hypothetical protein
MPDSPDVRAGAAHASQDTIIMVADRLTFTFASADEEPIVNPVGGNEA